MEKTSLYYPARKVFKVILAHNLARKRYRIVYSDPNAMSLIIRSSSWMLFKKFFEIKIADAHENICNISVSNIYTGKPDLEEERKLIQILLRLF